MRDLCLNGCCIQPEHTSDASVKEPSFWYRKNTIAFLLLPLSWLFTGLATVRRWYFVFAAVPVAAKVAVVGNISAGGSGKTPMAIALCEHFTDRGIDVGIVARGYAARNPTLAVIPHLVDPERDNAAICGDEPLLIAACTGVPVMVCHDRVKAAEALCERFAPAVIIADDGLQHYRLRRDVEIVMVEGESCLGNGFCLPAGPLRETPSRLRRADFVIVVNKSCHRLQHHAIMSTALKKAINLTSAASTTISALSAERKVLAIAGTAKPERFFAGLRAQGLTFEARAFPDHYSFRASDLPMDARIVMTSKDAVKCRPLCRRLGHHQCWEIPLEVSFSDDILEKIALRTRSDRGN